MPIGSGGVAGNTTAQVVASGKVLPVAGPSGVTVDTTTYDNEVTASGKFTTLVFPADNGALAIAVLGDAHPRMLLTASGGDGIYMGNGTAAVTSCVNLYAATNAMLQISAPVTCDSTLTLAVATSGDKAPRLDQVSPKFSITSGALPTLQLVSGAGAQVLTSRDAETVTPFTGDGTNQDATCTVQLSPDNVTYTPLVTLAIAGALNFVGVLAESVTARVPAGWYLKMTANHGTIGVTTYY